MRNSDQLIGCLRYCKSTIFQANHNMAGPMRYHFWLFAILQKYDFSSKSQHVEQGGQPEQVVCDTAKVRFFKQITTISNRSPRLTTLFAILQKYDFSSKSQPSQRFQFALLGCLRYCKSTIFQANHNTQIMKCNYTCVVCDTAKVRFFKQITTKLNNKDNAN